MVFFVSFAIKSFYHTVSSVRTKSFYREARKEKPQGKDRKKSSLVLVFLRALCDTFASFAVKSFLPSESTAGTAKNVREDRGEKDRQ